MRDQPHRDLLTSAGRVSIIRTSDELRRYATTEVTQPVPEASFREQLSALLERVPPGVVRDHTFVSLPAELPTWLDTGMDCQRGDAVSVFSTGRARPSSARAELSADVRLWLGVLDGTEARRGVLARVGADGDVVASVRASNTFATPRSGRLQLATRTGGDASPGAPRVDRDALVVRWVGDPLEGLEALRAVGDVGGILAAEIARHQHVLELPDGWAYAADGGPSEQFAADLRPGDGPVIGCYSCNRGALLHKDAVLPFDPGTTLRWAWKIDRLPSPVREDNLATHDYLSIAVEFDNGRDLTYHWSEELPVDYGYPCPVPGWEQRETHVVVRSGLDELGKWIDEERDVYADYVRHVGDPPRDIVRVWLLAVTFFQRREGQCDYGRIELGNTSTSLRVN